MNKIKNLVEWNLFGICSRVGLYLGISTARIRLWFIYLSFITLGSPIIVYMTLAILREIKSTLLHSSRNPVKWL